MGTWRFDQSKGGRRHVWQQTRGEQDPTRRDIVERMRAFPEFKDLKVEKLGGEIHIWREIEADKGPSYWASCMRLIGDSWGYYDVFYRTDERRWRSSGIEEMPIGRLLQILADFYREKFVN